MTPGPIKIVKAEIPLVAMPPIPKRVSLTDRVGGYLFNAGRDLAFGVGDALWGALAFPDKALKYWTGVDQRLGQDRPWAFSHLGRHLDGSLHGHPLFRIGDTANHIFYGGLNTLTGAVPHRIFNQWLGLNIQYFAPPPVTLRETSQWITQGVLTALPLRAAASRAFSKPAGGTSLSIPNKIDPLLLQSKMPLLVEQNSNSGMFVAPPSKFYFLRTGEPHSSNTGGLALRGMETVSSAAPLLCEVSLPAIPSRVGYAAISYDPIPLLGKAAVERKGRLIFPNGSPPSPMSGPGLIYGTDFIVLPGPADQGPMMDPEEAILGMGDVPVSESSKMEMAGRKIFVDLHDLHRSLSELEGESLVSFLKELEALNEDSLPDAFMMILEEVRSLAIQTREKADWLTVDDIESVDRSLDDLKARAPLLEYFVDRVFDRESRGGNRQVEDEGYFEKLQDPLVAVSLIKLKIVASLLQENTVLGPQAWSSIFAVLSQAGEVLHEEQVYSEQMAGILLDLAKRPDLDSGENIARLINAIPYSRLGESIMAPELQDIVAEILLNEFFNQEAHGRLLIEAAKKLSHEPDVQVAVLAAVGRHPNICDSVLLYRFLQEIAGSMAHDSIVEMGFKLLGTNPNIADPILPTLVSIAQLPASLKDKILIFLRPFHTGHPDSMAKSQAFLKEDRDLAQLGDTALLAFEDTGKISLLLEGPSGSIAVDHADSELERRLKIRESVELAAQSGGFLPWRGLKTGGTLMAIFGGATVLIQSELALAMTVGTEVMIPSHLGILTAALIVLAVGVFKKGEANTGEDFDSLTRELRNPDPEIRFRSLEALEKLRPRLLKDQILTALWQVFSLLTEADPRIRRLAAQTLKNFSPDIDPTTRVSLLDKLQARFGNADLVQGQLILDLFSTYLQRLRLNALEARRYKLEEILKSPDAGVRRDGVQALQAIVHQLSRPDRLPIALRLLSFIEDYNAQVRRRAFLALHDMAKLLAPADAGTLGAKILEDIDLEFPAQRRMGLQLLEMLASKAANHGASRWAHALANQMKSHHGSALSELGDSLGKILRDLSQADRGIVLQQLKRSMEEKGPFGNLVFERVLRMSAKPE